MQKKIVELSSLAEYEKVQKCNICGYVADHRLNINRINLGRDELLVSFNVCNSCLAKMQREIEICE